MFHWLFEQVPPDLLLSVVVVIGLLAWLHDCQKDKRKRTK